MPSVNKNPLCAIEPGEVVESYESLRLGDWSDLELLRAAAEIVSEPKLELNSFTMHEPLELLARFSLLPLVSPQDRRLARMQIVASTAVYRSVEDEVVGESGSRPHAAQCPSEITSDLRAAIREGNVEQSDQLFGALAEGGGVLDVAGSVADLSLRTLTGGAHTHIGLMLLLRMWPAAPTELLRLPRAGVRGMAAAPDLNLVPTKGHSWRADLMEALASVPRVPTRGRGIQGIVQTAEEDGLVAAVLEDGAPADPTSANWKDAIRITCRVAALSMLTDSVDGAKYIWTHCLTLPQAAWALAEVLSDPSLGDEAARSAVAWVTSFRASTGNGDLDIEPALEPTDLDLPAALDRSPQAAASVAWHASESERGRVAQVLATEAAVRIDSHLIKHTRACLDLAQMDADQAHLYLAAAAYLCALWCAEEPREAITEGLAARPGLDAR